MEDVACWPDADLPLALTNVQSCKWQTLKAPRPHYQAGRSKHWIKVRNRSQPSMERVMESFGTSKKAADRSARLTANAPIVLLVNCPQA